MHSWDEERPQAPVKGKGFFSLQSKLQFSSSLHNCHSTVPQAQIMHHSNVSLTMQTSPGFYRGRGKNKIVKCKSVTYWISKLPLITISSCFPGCLEHCSKQAKLINTVLIILLNSFKHITSALANDWLWRESEFYSKVRQKNQGTILQYFYFHIPPLGRGWERALSCTNVRKQRQWRSL